MAKDSFFGLNEKCEEISTNFDDFLHDRSNGDDFLLSDDADAIDFFQKQQRQVDQCAHAGFKLGSPLLNYEHSVDSEENGKPDSSIVKQFHSYERNCLNPDRSANCGSGKTVNRDRRSISSTSSGAISKTNSLNLDRSAAAVSPSAGMDEFFSLNPDQCAKKRRKVSSNTNSSTTSTEERFFDQSEHFSNDFSTNRSSDNDRRANSSRGAVYAKQYRQKNKQYVEGLHSALERSREENARLRASLSNATTSLSESRREVAYLRNVLANQSELSELIRGVQTAVQPMALKFRAPKSRDLPESIDNRQKSIKVDDEKERYLPAGICLHVTGREISLEFCASCSSSTNHNRNDESRRYLIIDDWRLFYDHILPRLFFVRRWRIEP